MLNASWADQPSGRARRTEITHYLRQLRALKRDVRLFLVTSGAVGFTILNGIYPVLFNLYLLRLGYGPALVGQVNAVGLLGYALFAIPAGLIGARLGLRRTMALGVTASLVCSGLQPMVGLVPPPWRAGWLMANQALSTMGLALFFVNANPFLIEATGERERSHAYSVRMVIDTLAGFLGSLVGGILPGVLARVQGTTLADPKPYAYALVLAAVLGAPAVAALLAMREGEHVEEDGDEAPRRTTMRAPAALIVAVSLVAVLRAAGLGASRTFFNVYLDDGLGISTAQIGALFATIQVASVPAALLMPALAERWGHHRVIVSGSAGQVLSMLPLALVPHWAAAALGRLGTYALSSITDPAIGVFQMEIVPRRWRSAMAGATSAALGLSWTAVAWGGGYVIAALGYRTMFLGAAALTAVGTLLFWALFRDRPAAISGGEVRPAL